MFLKSLIKQIYFSRFRIMMILLFRSVHADNAAATINNEISYVLSLAATLP